MPLLRSVDWRRTVCVLSVLASAPAIGGVARGAAAASVCAPAARVEGSGVAWSDVVADLRRRGIETSGVPDGCSVIHAQVRQGPEGLVVRVADDDGRIAERAVHAPDAAATFIESWTRADVVAPLLVPRADPAMARRAPVEVGAQNPPRDRLIAALSLSTAAETSLASDGSIWFGVNAGVCVLLGPACAGVLARVASDPGWSGDSEDQRSRRLAADALLGATLPIRNGRLTLLPGLALGLGWMRSTALHATGGARTVDVAGGGSRASASLRMSVRVLDDVALDLGFAADLAPFAHTAPYYSETTFLAGEPLAYFRVGVGMRIGVP